MPENMQHVFTVEEERIFKTTLMVAQSGYYRICVRYAHTTGMPG